MEHNEFIGCTHTTGFATLQTSINGHDISLAGDNNCGKDAILRRFTLVVFKNDGHYRNNITRQIFDSEQWIDEYGNEVPGTVENFITAINWCKEH